LSKTGSSTDKRTFTRDFVFAGDAATITDGRDTIMQFLAGHDISDEEEIDLLVALQEGLSNAVFHGCGDDRNKKIECTVAVDTSEIKIVIRDPGAGFNTTSGDSAEDGTNLTQHGRGIMLMRSLMDEITYRQGGSELHMKKLRRARG
jgi:anti-sigma regulatory factor (Ser/Thr protein kinase)